MTRILFHGYGSENIEWTSALAVLLPEARIEVWTPGDETPADYLIVRNPPAELLGSRAGLKAVFNLGAGIDYLLRLRARHAPAALEEAQVIRLEDAGMRAQMVDYVGHAVLHFYRCFHEYEQQQRAGIWRLLPVVAKANYPVGVLGAGVLGAAVAAGLRQLDFPVRVWSRSAKQIAGCESFTGTDGLPAFAAGLKALVNLLPLTNATEGILNRELFAHLAQGACLINVARGGHVQEADLLEALRSGKMGAARLDVFASEPLDAAHPFWVEPNVYLTPHISAENDVLQSVQQIAGKIACMERGQPVTGVVNWNDGY